MMVIDLLHSASETDRIQVREILDGERDGTTPEEVNWVIDLMVSSGAIGRAEDECQRRAADAETYLATIEDSEAKQTLAEMCSFLVERVF